VWEYVFATAGLSLSALVFHSLCEDGLDGLADVLFVGTGLQVGEPSQLCHLTRSLFPQPDYHT
jgi:hypothetical protein